MNGVYEVGLTDILKAVIFGIIEGVTEWLPISSTGHMILADEFVRMDATEAFMEMFLVVIQLGAILSVVVLYFNRLNPFSASKTKENRQDTLLLWLKVLIACVPAAIVGLLFDDMLNELFYNHITVAAMLILYGVLFILLEKSNKTRDFTITEMNGMSYKTAAMIGMIQLLSLIPGTSRSGATILGAMLLGATRTTAAEFSFFLAIPVMFGASALKLLKFGFDFTSSELLVLLTGMIAAFIISIVAIKFLMGYIKKNNFKLFGYYRIALGLIVIAYFAIK